jgi:Glycosyltransferase family 87
VSSRGRSSGPTAGPFGANPARRRFGWLACLIAAGVGWADLVGLAQAALSKNPPQAGFDLQLLIDAGKRVASGESPYDPNAVASGLQARNLFYSYPPIVAQLLAPFSSLPSGVILLGWGLGAAIGTAAIATLVARSPLGRPATPQVGLALDTALLSLALAPFFFPFTVAVLFGNMDAWFPLLFGAIALGLASGSAAPGRLASIAGGAALAFASAVKLHPGTLAVWLVSRWPGAGVSRRSIATLVGAAVVAGAAILAASLVVGGAGPWRDYVGYLSSSGSAGLASTVNIGPASQLALLTGNPDVAQPLAVVFGALAIAATVASALFVRDQLESFGWAIVASLVLLPVTWYHYAVALIPVALAALTRSRGGSKARRVTVALALAYVVSDVAILAPVALWLAVALLFVAVRWSAPEPSAEPAPSPGAEPAPSPGAEAARAPAAR